MSEKSDRSDRDGLFISGIIIVIMIVWSMIAFLPLIALRSPWFSAGSTDEVNRVQSVLGQLGTYGDMFGMLNCLFSGFGLIGVAYAIILQRRDLHNQQSEIERSAKASELQIRLAAYQSLADHHRDRRNTAGNDDLLKARSKGREMAYAEMMKMVLHEIEAHAAGKTLRESAHPYSDHPARTRNLRARYDAEWSMVDHPNASFRPVECLLLDLVEEIAALVELVRGNDKVEMLLDEAGDAANAAVKPDEAMDQPEATPEMVRAYQLQMANTAFRAAVEAVKALGFVI